jgi:hypothetical protein
MINLDCQPDWTERHAGDEHVFGCDCEGFQRALTKGAQME